MPSKYPYGTQLPPDLPRLKAASQLPRVLVYRILNESGGDISAGDAVMYVSGTASASVTVDLAVADGSVEAGLMLGLVLTDIADNASGYAVAHGPLDLDTSGWAQGAVLYIDPVTPGGLTDTQPTAPNLRNPVAIVLVSAVAGTLLVKIDRPDELAELADVYLNALADGEILVWDAGNSRWTNRAEITLDRLNVGDGDFNLENSSTPTINFDVNDALVYDRASNALELYIGGTLICRFSVDKQEIDRLEVGGTDFVLRLNSGDPIIDLDANDYLEFQQSTNQFKINLSSGTRAVFSPTETYLMANGVLKLVEVGAADSGGAGYRMLRVTN